MLTLKKLSLTNFGPFKETQTIDLEPSGVTVVYGENMRGKTTLLNAIRYALYGTVLTRHENQLSLAKIENLESAADGIHGFKVVLSFMSSDGYYELTRDCKLRENVRIPHSDLDYEQLFFLSKEGQVLAPSQAKTELTKIMPESVSRFFLFDGELLQQYEELLRDETDMGKKIKNAIERILGVPILTGARTTLKHLFDDAQKVETRTAQKSQETKELGNLLEQLLVQKASLEDEHHHLQKKLQDSIDRKRGLEEQQKQSAKMNMLFAERDNIQAQINQMNDDLDQKEKKLFNAMSQVWREILVPKLETFKHHFETELRSLKDQEFKDRQIREQLSKLREGLGSGICPTCHTSLDQTSKALFYEEIGKLDLLTSPSDTSDRITLLTGNLSLLSTFKNANLVQSIEDLNLSIDDIRIGLQNKKRRLNEIDELTKQVDESFIRRLRSDYDKSVATINSFENDIKKITTKLKDTQQNIDRVQKRLSTLTGTDLARYRKRREYLADLLDLFAKSIDCYCDELKSRVENDASYLFRKLTTEPDYKRLMINQNYGLSIVHKDDQVIPVRSAGAEHIVALSLMGALQKNAPLQGPIIMDSPFGRLDYEHTTKVVSTLPEMASQVMLLVYEAELAPNLARQHLKGHLKQEYQIVRQSARRSTIEVRHE